MAGARMAAIVVLGVPGEELAHDCGDAVFAAFEKDVDVIVHEGPGIDGTCSFARVLPEALVKWAGVVKKNAC